MVIYVVMPGDSVYSIAAEYGVSAQKIIADNRLEDGNRLAVGQTLVIQIPSQVHTVAAGESLPNIARQYGTTVDALLRNNPELNGRALIYPGQVLTIFLDTQRRGSLAVNGYAYPFIQEEEIRRVLPYLTYLTVLPMASMPKEICSHRMMHSSFGWQKNMVSRRSCIFPV